MTIHEDQYVDQAQAVIQKLSNKKNPRTGRLEPMVTTSKIRNLLAIAADIYNEVLNCRTEQLNEEIKGRIEYLRVRFTYESGRDTKVKEFVEGAKLLDYLKEIKGSKQNYILFHHYMEALIAFHRFYNGKDM